MMNTFNTLAIVPNKGESIFYGFPLQKQITISDYYYYSEMSWEFLDDFKFAHTDSLYCISVFIEPHVLMLFINIVQGYLKAPGREKQPYTADKSLKNSKCCQNFSSSLLSFLNTFLQTSKRYHLSYERRL